MGETGGGEDNGDGLVGVLFGVGRGAAAAFSCDACGEFDVACSNGDCDVVVGAVRRGLAKMPM